MFGLLPNSLLTVHRGQSGRLLSPRLWAHAYQSQLVPDGGDEGFFVGEDFRTFGLTTAVATNVGRYVGEAGAYLSFEDTGAAITQIATNRFGVATLTVDADDNQEAWLQSAGGLGVMGMISDTAGDDKLCVFEARFRVPQIVTQNLFIGLSEEGLAAGDTIDDSGDLASKDFIGFNVNEDAASTLAFVYRKAGQALQTPIAALKTLVADTFYNVGFVYNPKAPPSKRIAVYLDNAEQSTYVTKTNIEAATFPDGEELSFLAGVKNVSDITALHLDGWAFYQAG